MKDITLYTWPQCPYCNRTKKLLQENGYTYTDYNIFDEPEKKAELTEQTGQRTVPFIFVGDKLLGGCSDLEEALEDGTFKTLVEG